MFVFFDGKKILKSSKFFTSPSALVELLVNNRIIDFSNLKQKVKNFLIFNFLHIFKELI